MNVLVACEFSGIVRDAFRSRGHDAVSVDLLPSESDGPHIQDCIFHVLATAPWRWDLMIAFPPCTHLAVSGARWWKYKKDEQAAAIDFVRALDAAPIERVAIENPIGILSTAWRKPDQIVQPWWFGHGETKATCLWLKGLPQLEATNRHGRVWREPPSKDRWKNRSRTYAGLANAMADQWSQHLNDALDGK